MTFMGIRVKHLSCHLCRAILGLAVYAVVVFTQGCGSPPLEPWHTGNLTEEYTADMADEIRIFDDYLQLAEQLFAQL